jgi:Helix-turn-helix domain.
MRVKAYRFRAYTSKTTARVLKTQLEVACKLYNALLHAEQEEYEKNKRTMSMNELRQLALDLRKQNPEFQVLHSQVAQQVADRFYHARQRFFEGLANKPKKRSRTNTFPWCTLRVAGSFQIQGKLDKAKTKRERLDFALVKSASSP